MSFDTLVTFASIYDNTNNTEILHRLYDEWAKPDVLMKVNICTLHKVSLLVFSNF